MLPPLIPYKSIAEENGFMKKSWLILVDISLCDVFDTSNILDLTKGDGAGGTCLPTLADEYIIATAIPGEVLFQFIKVLPTSTDSELLLEVPLGNSNALA